MPTIKESPTFQRVISITRSHRELFAHMAALLRILQCEKCRDRQRVGSLANVDVRVPVDRNATPARRDSPGRVDVITAEDADAVILIDEVRRGIVQEQAYGGGVYSQIASVQGSDAAKEVANAVLGRLVVDPPRIEVGTEEIPGHA